MAAPLPDLRTEAQRAVDREIAAHASDLVANDMLFAMAVSRLFACSYEDAKAIALHVVHDRCKERIACELRRRKQRTYDYPGHLAALQLKLAVEARMDLAPITSKPVDLRAL